MCKKIKPTCMWRCVRIHVCFVCMLMLLFMCVHNRLIFATTAKMRRKKTEKKNSDFLQKLLKLIFKTFSLKDK